MTRGGTIEPAASATPAISATQEAPASERTAQAAPAAVGAVEVLPHLLQATLGPDEVVILLLRPSLFYIPLSSLGTLVASVLIGTALLYAARFQWSPWSEGDAILIGGGLAALRLAWAGVDWWYHLYALTDRRILARYGVFRTQLYEAPLSRIQNTVVVQRLRERLFGLGTLGFSTAGRGNFDAFWEMLRAPYAVHRTVLDAVERYGRR